jgi:hypothetical protein
LQGFVNKDTVSPSFLQCTGVFVPAQPLARLCGSPALPVGLAALSPQHTSLQPGPQGQASGVSEAPGVLSHVSCVHIWPARQAVRHLSLD